MTLSLKDSPYDLLEIINFGMFSFSFNIKKERELLNETQNLQKK